MDDVRLAQDYRVWMWLLLPLTFGAGTFALWLRARRWPRRVDETGILLRDGRFVLWHDITRLGVTQRQVDKETIQLDLYFKGGVARVPIRHLDNGAPIAAAIRANFQRAKN